MSRHRKRRRYKKLFYKALIPLVLLLFFKAFFIKAPVVDPEKYVKSYVSRGIFNQYKLQNIELVKLTFSNGKYAVVDVIGRRTKKPYDVVRYDVYLDKVSKGWKVEKIAQKDRVSNEVIQKN